MLGAAAVLTVATTVLVVATSWPDDSTRAGARSGSCAGEVRLSVIAAPSIAPAIHAIAADWQGTHPMSDGVCVQVSVTAEVSRKTEQALVNVSTGTVWIPDSTVWSSRLSADASSLTRSHLVVGKSVAKSPLVVAAATARAGPIATAAKNGWVGVLSASARVVLPSPTATTEGALALLGLQAQLGGSTAAVNTLGHLLSQLSERVVPNTAAGFSAVKDYPTTAPAFVASEQQVLAMNEGTPAPVTTPVYPSGVAPALDYPFVTITPSRESVYAHALQQFERQLTAPAATGALNAAHLRDANAAPFQAASDGSGPGSNYVTLAPQPTDSTVTSALRRWVAVGTSNQLLAVVDVSGSMKDDSGDGQSKIQAAADAATTAMTLMPDGWSAGLWTFSRRPPPATDWTQLVPLGSLQSRRAALLSAVRSMPSRIGGDTGLYSTALAAFKTARARYAAHKTNSVVLITDGANVDPDDGDLPTLLKRLKALRDPRRPVSIITIALGKDADVHALQQISALTGGRNYAVPSAQEIRTVFVRIALRR